MNKHLLANKGCFIYCMSLNIEDRQNAVNLCQSEWLLKQVGRDLPNK